MTPDESAPVAGDFLNCCGEERGPWGDKAAAACEVENGVDA